MFYTLFSKIKNNHINFIRHLIRNSYRFVIWTELTNENKLHLEIVSINYSFERNKTILGLHYNCTLDENEIFHSLLEIKNKYKIIELIETNYKFKNPQILSAFIITKTSK